MMIPTIHLNGTGGDALLDQLLEAVGAVRTAEQRLSDAAPNGRDYYPQGPDALRVAQAEHIGRAERLAGVRKELEELAEQVCRAIDERKSTGK